MKDAPINIEVLKSSMDELMALAHSKASASETYTEAVKAVSEKSGATKAVIRKLVSARIKNNEAEEKADAEALAELIGEIA